MTQENEGKRKILSVIPILRFARAILLTSALISFYQISSWQWQQSEFHFNSTLPTIYSIVFSEGSRLQAWDLDWEYNFA